MLDHFKLKDVLFIDVETVPLVSDYSKLKPELKILWDAKAKWLIKEEENPEYIFERAGIYAEFGKVVCISVGFIHEEKISYTYLFCDKV